MDLYQLNNANGRQFRLLEIYAKKKPLTANFAQKNAFYELFTELEALCPLGRTPYRQNGSPSRQRL